MAQLVHAAHVAPWKKDEVAQIKKLVHDHPVVAVVGIGGIPSPQMLKMRAQLREHGEMKSGKNNLMEIAIEECESDFPGIKALLEHFDGQVMVLATDVNPFKLYKQLVATRQMMPAKAGDIAPNDITIEKQETPHKPGPIVGELQQAGIPAAIEQGKVVIKKTTTVVKAGEPISAALANGLAKLEIYPIEVGMRLLAVYEDGFVFHGDQLKVDEVAFGADLVRAIQGAINLGVNAPVYEAALAPLIIMKAQREAIGVALEAGWMSKITAPMIIGKATRQALAVAALVAPEALDDEAKAMLSQAATAAAAAPAAAGQAEAKKEEPEEPAVSEEEAASGLGALFG